MTDVVQLTIDLGALYLSQFQQIVGQIAEDHDDHIVFRDAESEKTHKILKKRIVNVTKPSTALIEGS